jgi:hypothetical protein
MRKVTSFFRDDKGRVYMTIVRLLPEYSSSNPDLDLVALNNVNENNPASPHDNKSWGKVINDDIVEVFI